MKDKNMKDQNNNPKENESFSPGSPRNENDSNVQKENSAGNSATGTGNNNYTDEYDAYCPWG
jgi:hypothetical protein